MLQTDDPAPAPATRIQAENRQSILSAALPVFSARGYRAATVDELARAAGMSKANLLYYFRRKEDIYRAVLQATLERWLAPLGTLDPDGDPEAELVAYIRAKMRLSAERPDDSRLFANEILHGAPIIGEFLRGPLKSLVEDKAAVIERWVADGRLAPMDPVHLIFVIWAATQHYADFDVQVRAILPERSREPNFADEAADAVSRIVLHGVLPR